MYSFFRIFFLALYVICFLAAFAAFYTATFFYQRGAAMTSVVLWVVGGIILTVIAFLLYRVYRKLSGR